MNFSESVRIAFVNLFANKLRSLLSMLGIIIGVAAVISVVAITNGIKEKALAELGPSDFFVYFLSPQYQARSNRQVSLTADDLRMFDDLPFVRAVLPKMFRNFEVRSGARLLKGTVSLTDPGYLKTYRKTLLAGRNINDFDMMQRSEVCLVSDRLAAKLFGDPSRVGQPLFIGRSRLTVVGVVRSDAAARRSRFANSGEFLEKDDVMVPYSTFLRLRSDLTIDQLEIYVAKGYGGNVLQDLKFAIQRKERKPEDYFIQDPKELLAQIEKQTRMFSAFLASIASISLLVGGVGVMNVMLTTVAERTREIGVRKAVGASQRDILLQFVIESCVICLVGGCIGVLLGVAVSRVLPVLSGGKIPTSIVESSVALSFAFSLATGLVFGIFPAVRASRLSPAEALRTE